MQESICNIAFTPPWVGQSEWWATGLLVDGGEYRNNWEWRPGIALGNRQMPAPVTVGAPTGPWYGT